MTNVIPINMQ